MIVMMWREKYRPGSLAEIEGQDDVIDRLKSFTERKQVPNLLLWGSRGVGKTSSVLALAQELYGSHDENLFIVECRDFVEQRKKWLRADKRFRFYYDEHKSALDIFKDMIRSYAVLAPINAAFKLMAFNNADLLPVDAQQALRRIMERSSRTSRFIFITTKPSAIIPAIRSRCLNLLFQPLIKTGAMDRLLLRIASQEELELTDQGLAMLKRYAGGDAGTAIDIMEAASAISNSNRIDSEEIVVVAQELRKRSNRVADLIDMALAGRYRELRAELKRLMRDEKMSGREIVEAIHDIVLQRKARLGARRLAKVMIHIGDADYKLCSAFNSMIHIEELVVRCRHFYSNSGSDSNSSF